MDRTEYINQMWELREGLAKNDPDAVERAKQLNAQKQSRSPASRALTIGHDCGKGIVFTLVSGKRWCTACGDL